MAVRARDSCQTGNVSTVGDPGQRERATSGVTSARSGCYKLPVRLLPGGSARLARWTKTPSVAALSLRPSPSKGGCASQSGAPGTWKRPAPIYSPRLGEYFPITALYGSPVHRPLVNPRRPGKQLKCGSLATNSTLPPVGIIGWYSIKSLADKQLDLCLSARSASPLTNGPDGLTCRPVWIH
jgi:hypothetical protein